MDGLNPDDVSFVESDADLVLLERAPNNVGYLGFNTQKAPFDNPLVRRAMNHAVNKEALIAGLYNNLAVTSKNPLPPGYLGYNDSLTEYSYDPEKAKALLAEAGHPDGFSATLKLPPPPYARQGGEVIASQLREVGIELEIIPIEWAQWLEQVFTGFDYDMTIVAHTEPLDIGIYAREDYYFNYDDPVMRALMQGLDRTADEAERAAILEAAQERVAEKYVNAFLFQLAKTGVADARIEGLWENSPTQANDMTRVRWAE
jgi:peptide/nickel transport system substrate-binding protein